MWVTGSYIQWIISIRQKMIPDCTGKRQDRKRDPALHTPCVLYLELEINLKIYNQLRFNAFLEERLFLHFAETHKVCASR